LYQKDELGVRFTEIYDEVAKLPLNQSVAIDINDISTTTPRAWNGRNSIRYTIEIYADIIYYHEEMDDKTRKRDTMRIVWRIAQMFMQHVTVNGFCPQLGAEVLSADYNPQIIGQKIMSAGIVRVKLNKLHQVVSAD